MITQVSWPGSFLRFYHSPVTKHVDLQEDAKQDSKCAFKIFRPVNQLKLNWNHLKKATCDPTLASYVAELPSSFHFLLCEHCSSKHGMSPLSLLRNSPIISTSFFTSVTNGVHLVHRYCFTGAGYFLFLLC